jgi:undecaprenyl-diphosphatase
VRKRRVPLVPLGVAGAAAAALWVRKVVLPARPDDVSTAPPRRIPDPDARPAPDGAGLRIAVNPDSGPAWRGDPLELLRAELPAADIRELGPDDDLVAVLRAGLPGDVVAIGAAGGDGTLSAAAGVAMDEDLVLVAVPSGTFNHLARDLGLDGPEDAVAAVRAGTAVRMDVGCVTSEGDPTARTFVNTLSFGGYTQVVDARERLQPRIGKWAALAVALARELPRMEPLHLEVGGEPATVWLGWIGNGAYAPTGFAPSWRETLDDGVLDVRLVLGDRRFARLRLVVEVVLGRLRRCPVYREQRVDELTIVCRDGPLRLAVDGETFDGAARFAVTKRRRALAVAVPPND